jgi:predicted O-methyltransferase YrrM
MLLIPEGIRKVRTRHKVLIHLIRANHWKTGAEIGVMRGGLYFDLLDNTHLERLIGVDIWENDAEYENRDMPAIGDMVKEMAKAYGDRAAIFHTDSVAAASEVDDASLDFVFIDAKHDFNSVSADIVAWLQKVKRNGYLLGHDINWGSVKKAVEKHLVHIVLPGNVWVGLARQC